MRVENVQERRRGTGTLWTKVHQTSAGRDVRADFRCLRRKEPSTYAWEQEVEGSPFAKVFSSAQTEIDLEDADEGTRVTIVVDQTLRGMSRFGGFMVRRATAAQLDEALESLASLFEGTGDAGGEATAGRPPQTRERPLVSSGGDQPSPPETASSDRPAPADPDSSDPGKRETRELDA